jgi:hypothetical protein
MNPTTFNLLAVSVFAFVLLSLVGPLLNISPGAVAIALTGCASLLALDRFGWQGKGGNLLIDLLSGASSEYRQRILHHEAGHFLAAHLLDIPVQSYTLSAWQGLKAGLPGLGGVVVEPVEMSAIAAPGSDAGSGSGDSMAQQLNRYSIVWMAGIAAETQVYGSAQGGDDDQAQLRRLWTQASPEARAMAAADAQIRWALLQATTLIETQQKAYEALVQAMANQVSVPECCALIDSHKVAEAISQ